MDKGARLRLACRRDYNRGCCSLSTPEFGVWNLLRHRIGIGKLVITTPEVGIGTLITLVFGMGILIEGTFYG